MANGDGRGFPASSKRAMRFCNARMPAIVVIAVRSAAAGQRAGQAHRSGRVTVQEQARARVRLAVGE